MYLLVKILICLLIFSLFQILGGGFHYWIITVTPRETITYLLLLLLIIAACLNHAMPSPIQLTEEGHQQKIFNRILNFDFLNFIWILLLVAEFALFKYASPQKYSLVSDHEHKYTCNRLLHSQFSKQHPFL